MNEPPGGGPTPTGPPEPDDLVLGLDVGGTKLAAGVVGGDGRVLSLRIAPSRVEGGPSVMIARHLELGA
jgi:glucokinase